MEATKQEPHQQPPHILILPSPGLGHLISLTQFARRLLLHHPFFNITFLIPSDTGTTSSIKPQTTILESLPTAINHIYLPPVNVRDIPQGTEIEIRIALTVTRSLPALRHELIRLSGSRIAALVVDSFGLSAIEVAKEFGISTYAFYLSTAMCLSLALHMPELDKIYTGEYRDLPEPIKLPGCVPLHGKDFMDTVQQRSRQAYKGMLQRSNDYNSADGILINSFMDLESGALKALKEDQGLLKPPVYPIGPLIQSNSRSSKIDFGESHCLKWLDEQPERSVLFVSFGSGGTLSQEQLDEVAYGLEMSEQRFLWVVKSPSETAANAAFFSNENAKNPSDFLPKGFLERTKEKGLVVPSWAPQIEILSHGATGGFLTHCGWNSILESIVHGVPLIAWPLFAEQKMNSVLVTEGLKVAVRVKVNESSGLVGREEIAKCAEGLIEGEEGKKLGNSMKDLKDAAARALREDGSSAKALSEVARQWSCFNIVQN